jgi:hypothetical protein
VFYFCIVLYGEYSVDDVKSGLSLICSSLGQNLQTSTYVWEIAFAMFIAIIGLVLFSLLIGNMQVST